MATLAQNASSIKTIQKTQYESLRQINDEVVETTPFENYNQAYLNSIGSKAPYEWKRPTYWLNMPEIQDNEDNIAYLLFAVYYGSHIYMRVPRTSETIEMTVDWGDGTIDQVECKDTSQLDYFSHEYDFNSVPDATYTSKGYKQALVKITLPDGYDFNGFHFGCNYALTPIYMHPVLDICAKMSKLSFMTLNGSNNEDMVIPIKENCPSRMLERFRLIGSNELTNLTGAFYNCSALKVVEIESSNIVNWNNTFAHSGLDTIPNLDFSNANEESENIFAYSSIKLAENANLNNTNGVFYGCTSLEYVNNITFKNIAQAPAATDQFYGCDKLREINNLTSTDTATIVIGGSFDAFVDCWSLYKMTLNIDMAYTDSTISFTSCKFLKDMKPPLITHQDYSGTSVDRGLIRYFGTSEYYKVGNYGELTIVNTPAAIHTQPDEFAAAQNNRWTIVT